MSKAKEAVKLTWDGTSKQWRKVVGEWESPRTGKVVPKVWGLGADRPKAEQKALAVLAVFRLMKGQGRSLWTAGDLARVEDLGRSEEERVIAVLAQASGYASWEERGSVERSTAELSRLPHRVTADWVDPAAVSLTVGDVCEKFVAELKAAAEAGTKKLSHCQSQAYRLAKAVEADTGVKGRPLKSLPIATLTSEQIRGAVHWLVSRPSVPKPAAKGQTPKTSRMSYSYAASCLSSLRWLLEWANRRDYWTSPKTFSELWDVSPILTPDEERESVQSEQRGRGLLNGDDPDSFTLPQLTTLYVKASPRVRAYILLGLNCGFANMELATLRRAELIDLDGLSPKIGRFRLKTKRNKKQEDKGVWAQWSLWPETVTALRPLLTEAQTFPMGAGDNGLCLLTQNGKPLVEDGEYGHKDAVVQAWRKLSPPLSFKYLRKTAAGLLRTGLGLSNGTELAEMLLSHSDKGQVKAYSGRDWDALSEATGLLRQYLSPLFKTAKE